MISADKVLTESQLAKLLKTIREEKLKALLSIQNASRPPRKEVRTIVDYFLFSVIANTGLRISEALQIELSDLHSDFLTVREEISKSGKKGTVYFGNKTKKLLDDWLEIRRSLLKHQTSKRVFSLTGKTTSRSYMHTRFKMWLSRSGLPGTLSIHSLRHTYGTHCLDKGLSLTFVRDNLRHSNISITSQYLHLTKENRDKVKDLF
jgi:site-specific recombinase XerD